jgi:hypothetical protein
MLIANPIYDVVFKRLMENEKVAKFFIGTLLDQVIESVEVKSQEFTYLKDLDLEDPMVIKFVKQKVQERLSINILRLDFIATIKTETGQYKKILIEIQKSNKLIDIMRFRRYLAEQYTRGDKVENKKEVLPITTIYLLGFNLPELETPCIKIERNYKDLTTQNILTQRSEFIEKLTHDSYIVQVKRITDRYQTRLDKLLSIFEQRHFVENSEIVKEYLHEPDTEDLKTITTILHHSGTNPTEKKKLEVEQEAWRTIEAFFEEKEELLEKQERELREQERELREQERELREQERELREQERELREKNQVLAAQEQALALQKQKIVQQDQVLAEKDQVLAEKDQVLAEKDQVLAEKDQVLAEKDQVLAEKDQVLAEKDQVLAEKDQVLAEKDQELAEMRKQMEELKNKISN